MLAIIFFSAIQVIAVRHQFNIDIFTSFKYKNFFFLKFSCNHIWNPLINRLKQALVDGNVDDGMSSLIVSHYFSASASHRPPWISFKITCVVMERTSLWNHTNLGLNPSFPCGSSVVLENLLNFFELWFADLHWEYVESCFIEVNIYSATMVGTK